MKHVKKIFAFALTLVMALAVALPAFAEDDDAGSAPTATTGTIVVSNSAKNEDYVAYKIFDAKISDAKTSTGDAKSIAYTYPYGDALPTPLSKYFQMDAKGNVYAKQNTLSETESTEIANWAKSFANIVKTDPVKGTGGELRFEDLALGYYVVTTSQGNGIVSIDSTNPVAEITDKNTTTPITPPSENSEYKTVDDTDVYIGQELTYTVSFKTANYYDKDKLITEYTINDDFADGKLEVIGDPTVQVVNKAETETKTLAKNTDYTVANWGTKNTQITIRWANQAKTESLYDNGAKIILTYKAKLISAANIAGDGNTNTATINYKYKNPGGGDDIPGTSVENSTTVKTYAIAIKKVDQAGNGLAGAVFTLPFYVDATADTDGYYVYAGNQAREGLINELTTPDGGVIVIKGLESGNAVSITETTAPSGYNKLTAPVSVTPAPNTEKTTHFRKVYDKDGKEVESATTETTTVVLELTDISATTLPVINKTGTTMPSTGGIGTTIFYVVGGVMVAGAVVFLLTKRRAAAAE